MIEESSWRHSSSSMAPETSAGSADLAAEALRRGRRQSDTPTREPWPLDRWPDVPTRFILCRNDRLLPAPFLRRVVHERLGITPDEIDGGHCVALSRPKQLAQCLERQLATTKARRLGEGVSRDERAV
jgi:pimeloyl-ACP methyl ester carboxylesterase